MLTLQISICMLKTQLFIPAHLILRRLFRTYSWPLMFFQRQLFQIKLVLNERKTKLMVFSSLKVNRWSHLKILTIKGQKIDRVTYYKYLGIWLDEKVEF